MNKPRIKAWIVTLTIMWWAYPLYALGGMAKKWLLLNVEIGEEHFRRRLKR